MHTDGHMTGTEAEAAARASETQKLEEMTSTREGTLGDFSGPDGKGSFTFPRNTNDHPAWVRMQIIERVSGGFDNMFSGEIPKGKNLGAINLYMPQTITFSDGLTYDNAELTGITSAFAATVNEFKESKSFTQAAGVAVAGGSALFSDAMRAKTSLGAARAQAAGVAINPRAAMLFKAPTFRQLALAFKLIPSNATESNIIRMIINYVRLHAYPQLIAGGASFMFPNLFRISFLRFGPNGNTNPFIIPFADAYCTGITTNYNAASPALMQDGAPSEVDLTLNFQETKVLDRKSIMEMAGMDTGDGLGSVT